MSPNEVIDELTQKLSNPELDRETFDDLVERIKVLKQLQES